MGNHIEHDSHSLPRGYGPSGHATVGGLAVAANGYRFAPSSTHFTPGDSADWEFRVVREDGSVETAFEEAHDQRGHLIVVRRDLTRFQHLHPTLEDNGTWRVEGFTLPEPGVYRAFIDVVIDGRPLTLGFDLFADGSTVVEPQPDAGRRATVEEYTVELSTDEAVATRPTRLTFEIRRDRAPVTRLDPYLGALGHLVGLREGDLAYVHVHPEETNSDSGRVEFVATFPTPGKYRLFFQAKPDGNLITTAHDIRSST
ncbi:hypothetical protein BV210_18335 (plasmid) [Halorientalis sp. IM1011]|uniref:hypothetical protein n=1 Tax=Halorientalis sp. IM1011 TaxID=1932360 RepID=UPI00097CD087|nr:hypothetical protein [Halorientalis sp. IM1011]AQL44713.1 hypothetical protein BV210_18335 [Halorientalis sp. IM1011]